jgi:hypothetical protein
MFTFSGERVMPGGETAPTLDDVVRGLGRMPRFAGQGREPYTVLQHSLAGYFLACFRQFSTLDRCYVLLHDGHEAITGDVPTDWKPPELQALQHELDRRIYRSLHVPEPSMASLRLVAEIDRAILMAEGKLVGPPRFPEWRGYVEPDADALVMVEQVRRYSDAVQAETFLGAFDLCTARMTSAS